MGGRNWTLSAFDKRNPFLSLAYLEHVSARRSVGGLAAPPSEASWRKEILITGKKTKDEHGAQRLHVNRTLMQFRTARVFRLATRRKAGYLHQRKWGQERTGPFSRFGTWDGQCSYTFQV